MALASNRQGFLVGERIIDSIDLVGKDTAEILALMKQGYKRSLRNAFAARYAPSNQVTNDIDGSGRNTLPSLDAEVRNTNPLGNASRTREIDTAARVRRADVLREAGEPATRNRAVNGRFVGAGGPAGNPAGGPAGGPQSESMIKKALVAIGLKVNAPDAQGVDPTIDALKEAGVFKAIGVVANAGSWLFGKFGKKDKDKDDKKHKSDDAYKDRNKSTFSWLGTIFGSLIGKAVTAALATAAIVKAGGAVNDAIQNTDTGRGATDALGTVIDTGRAAFGNQDAQDRVNDSFSVNDRQMKVYSAFQKTGIPDRLAMAYTATVGREHQDYGNDMFGTHPDASGNDTNLGFVSWQGDRKANLRKYMGKQGLLDDKGNIVHTQAAINAMAQFKIDEPQFQEVLKAYKANPNMSDADLRGLLATKDIGWARGQNTLRNGKSFDWRKHDNVEKSQNDNLKAQLGQTVTPTIPQAVNPTTTTPASANLRDAKTQTGMPVPQTAPRNTPPPIPAAPKTQTQVSSRIPVQQSAPQVSDAISQNLADRNLAHAVTGGLGMDRWVG